MSVTGTNISLTLRNVKGSELTYSELDGNQSNLKTGIENHSHDEFAPVLGADDNYVTDAEKTKLANLSGVNSGDQDLSGYSLTSHNHNLNDLTEKSYNSLTDKPTIPSVSGLLDETAHDLLDHTGLTGIPTAYTDEMAQDAVGAAIAAGTQTGIIVAYDDVNNKIDFTVNAAGSGDVTGPASAVSDNIALFDGITGKIIKDSGVATSNFAPALGVDDNYVTGVEKIKLANLSGVNTGDQDLSDYSLTSHLHTGIYEPADATILRDADIGVAVQAYDADLTSWAAIATSAKQDTLVSGTNIKTINTLSLLGAGDISIPVLTDGDKGDVVVSGGGSNWTVKSVAGNLSFLGAGTRIRGDFSNATIASRAMFQTSTVNAATNVGVIPNGTGAACSYQVWASSDPTNSALGFFQANSTTGQIVLASGVTGTGTYLPMAFHTGGSETLRLTTDKRIQADFSNATIANRAMFQTSTVDGNTIIQAIPNGAGTAAYFGAHNNSDTTNFSRLLIGVTQTLARIESQTLGTGGLLPLTFWTGGYQRLNLATDGTFTSVSGAMGYGTGAGGTVTQATSKSTTVTLNKPCGQITMNNAALAAGATVYFTLNNSLIGAADIIHPNTYANGFHRVAVQYMGIGSVTLAVTNVDTISHSDAVVINFAIIKGATS